MFQNAVHVFKRTVVFTIRSFCEDLLRKRRVSISRHNLLQGKKPVSTTNTIYATHLYAVATTNEKTNVKEDESSVKTGTVQIVQQGVKSDKEADQTSRTCAGEEPLPERKRETGRSEP